MRRAALALMAFCVTPILALTGQEPASARVGQRVRLKTDATASSPWLVGTLVADDRDSLRLQVADSTPAVSVARRTVTRFEVSRGLHSNAGKGALYGGVIFGGLTFVGALNSIGSNNLFRANNAGEVVAWTLFEGAGGAGIGALIGALSHSERWETVSLSRSHVTLTPRGAGVALSLTF